MDYVKRCLGGEAGPTPGEGNNCDIFLYLVFTEKICGGMRSRSQKVERLYWPSFQDDLAGTATWFCSPLKPTCRSSVTV